MLNIIRKNASRWIIKVIFSTIILTFIFFFGYSKFADRYKDARSFVAVVGGTAIPRAKFEASVDQSLKKIREQWNNGEWPDNMTKILKHNVLDGLIEREVTVLYAERLGLTVTDEEVAKMIRSNKNLFPDEAGDAALTSYEERFLPSYLQHYGEEFEEAIRKDLLVDRFRATSLAFFEPWQKELAAGDMDAWKFLSAWTDRHRESLKVESFEHP